MKIAFKYILSFVICLSSSIMLAQNIDSLKADLKNAKNDTTKLKLLVQLSDICDLEDILKYSNSAIDLADKILADGSNHTFKRTILKNKAIAINNIGFLYSSQANVPMALDYYQKSLKLQEEIGNEEGIGNSLNNIGFCYSKLGNNEDALIFYNKALKLRESSGDKRGIANSLNNIGQIYDNQGDIAKALIYYDKSLHIEESLGNKKGQALTLNNIAHIYCAQGDAAKGLSYHQKSLKLRQEINDLQGIALSLNAIGVIYDKEGNNEKALVYYTKSLALYEKVGDKHGIGWSLTNIGISYRNLGDLKKTLDCFFKGLQIRKEIHDKEGIASSFTNIGAVYYRQGKYSLAYLYADSSLTLAKKLGFPDIIFNAEKVLTKIDSARGNLKGAFEHFKQYILFKDSINNESTRKASIKSQLKYEFEKKEAIIKEQQEKERIIAEEKNRFQKIVIASVVIGLLLVIIFAAFVLRSLKVTKHQKHIIEEKQKEILDSIRYAKRIQTSLLPSEKYIAKQLQKK